MNSRKIKRWLLLNLPYIIVGILATNLGEGWRLAQGETVTDKISTRGFESLSLRHAKKAPYWVPFLILCLAFISLICVLESQ